MKIHVYCFCIVCHVILLVCIPCQFFRNDDDDFFSAAGSFRDLSTINEVSFCETSCKLSTPTAAVGSSQLEKTCVEYSVRKRSFLERTRKFKRSSNDESLSETSFVESPKSFDEKSVHERSFMERIRRTAGHTFIIYVMVLTERTVGLKCYCPLKKGQVAPIKVTQLV